MKLSYTEYNVIEAIHDVKNRNSLRSAAIEWGIPRSTLYNRLNDTTTCQEAASHL